jgi:acyl carrier protein
MGLDSVELVMAFEEAFGVAIEDADAEKMITPGHVIDHIVRCRGVGTKNLCVTRRAFHRIRERLMEVGVQRSAIRPGTSLAEFFPEDTRRSLWAIARGPISVHQWPELVRPAKLQKIITTVSLLVAGTVLISSLISPSGRKILDSFLLAIVSAAGTSLLLLQITQNQCRQFPGITTVRDLTIRVTAGGAASLLWKHEEFARGEIASLVKQIVIEQLGIRESDYAENKEFVRDLGMN